MLCPVCSSGKLILDIEYINVSTSYGCRYYNCNYCKRIIGLKYDNTLETWSFRAWHKDRQFYVMWHTINNKTDVREVFHDKCANIIYVFDDVVDLSPLNFSSKIPTILTFL